jgi:hypothetical protein
MFIQIAKAFQSWPAAGTARQRSAPAASADRLRHDLSALCRAHGAAWIADAEMVSIRPARAGRLPVEIVIDRGRRAIAFGDWVSDLDTDAQVLALAEMALAGRLRLRITARGRAREWTLEQRQADGAWTEISTMGVLGGGANDSLGALATSIWWNPPADVH